MAEAAIANEMIQTGKRLHAMGLAVARSGNISAREDDATIFITATGCCLGTMTEDDIVKVSSYDGRCMDGQLPSTELPLHLAIYNDLSVSRIIHCHPPLINAYFAAYGRLKTVTFESEFYLGTIHAIEQETPSVTQLSPVVHALKNNNQAVLKKHGTVTVARSFPDALGYIEALNDAVRTAAVARLFKKDYLDELDIALKEDLTKKGTAYEMFSMRHIRAIVDKVNDDEFVREKGRELDLTVQMAIKMDGCKDVFKLNFEKGAITDIGSDDKAPFVISAPSSVWRQVFDGNLDSFVAVTQGKMKLTGNRGQLSKWYVPFSRIFALFKDVAIWEE
jgi:L-fuculose-phosphate aldolase